MAMGLEVALVILIGIFVCLRWLWRLGSGRTMGVLPRELRYARLIYAEHVFRSIRPVSITAKVDRVYQNAAGELVLLELKTRWAHRVYFSDVIELSAQRVAVMAQSGMPVAGHAYVLTEDPTDRKAAWHRVGLMKPGAVVALALRRQALLSGETNARCARPPGICRTCGYRRKCRLS